MASVLHYLEETFFDAAMEEGRDFNLPAHLWATVSGFLAETFMQVAFAEEGVNL